MLTPISVISIMMMTLGVVGILFLIYFAFMHENPFISLWIIPTIIVLLLPSVIMYTENVATKADVLSGKAHYIKEVNYVEKNDGTIDTITTYSLQFKPKVYKTVER